MVRQNLKKLKKVDAYLTLLLILVSWATEAKSSSLTDKENSSDNNIKGVYLNNTQQA